MALWIVFVLTADKVSGAMLWPSAVAAPSEDPYMQSAYNIVNSAYLQSNNSIPLSNAFRLLGPISTRIELPGDDNPMVAGQCVNYVKYVTGVEYSGNANTWEQYINSDSPIIGSIVVIKIGRFGHLGIVVKMRDESIVVRSRNYEGLWIISDNSFELNDIRIIGYINY